jgi:hypothetical protein
VNEQLDEDGDFASRHDADRPLENGQSRFDGPEPSSDFAAKLGELATQTGNLLVDMAPQRHDLPVEMSPQLGHLLRDAAARPSSLKARLPAPTSLAGKLSLEQFRRFRPS